MEMQGETMTGMHKTTMRKKRDTMNEQESQANGHTKWKVYNGTQKGGRHPSNTSKIVNS